MLLGILLVILSIQQWTNHLSSYSRLIAWILILVMVLTCRQVFFAVFQINVLGLVFAKLSILFFYRRIFNTGHNKAFNYTTIVLAIFVILWGIAFFFVGLLSCGTHVSANWGTYDDIVTYCVSGTNIDMTYVVTDTFADLVLFILPIPLVWTRLCLRLQY